MRKLFAFLMVLSLLPAGYILAQGGGQQVRGKVVDNAGEALVGVSVVVQGTTTGVTTSADGSFSIACPSDGTLVFSFIGMENQTVKPGGRNSINVVMRGSAVELEGIVKIGYGSMQRKDLTGAVSSISAADIEAVPVANVAQALAGRIPGVQVTQSSGAPDSEVSIRVRGGTSITGSNQPLYVIDGFPNEDGLIGIDPSDIESIDVLKDASATAIYGSRGANGIIIVTTKGGKKGRVSVNYDMYYGWKDITDKLDVLSGYDYVMLDYERVMLSGSASDMTKFENNYGQYADIEANWGNRKGIDWQDEVFGRKPSTQMHKFSVRGGSDNTNFTLSYTRSDDQGLLYGSGLVRDAFTAKFNYVANKKLKVGANLSFIDQRTRGIGSLEQEGRFSKLRNIIQYRPVGGLDISDEEFLNTRKDPMLEDESGNLLQNPINNMTSEKQLKRNKILSANADLEYTIIPGLTYRGMVGMRQRNNVINRFFTAESVQAERSGGPYGYNYNHYYESFSFNNTLTYDAELGRKHALTAMVGQEQRTDKYHMTYMGGGGFPEYNFTWDDYGLMTIPYTSMSDRRKDNKLSFFARANYQYDSKYLFSASLRADGSSKFGKNNKWGYFPAVSGAWRMSEEDFIRNLNVFSNLKLRLGYGASGNDDIGSYKSLSLMSASWVSVNNLAIPVYSSTTLANPDLKWETNITTNLGLDMGFLNNRLHATVDLYNIKTKNLLLEAEIPYLSGYSSTTMNIGSTRSRGIEFSLSSYNIEKKNFSWRTSFNISFSRTKVLSLANSDRMLIASNWNGDFKDSDYLIEVGRSTGLMYGFVTDGIYTVDDFTYENGKWNLNEGIPYIKGEESSLLPGSRKYKNINDEGDSKGIIDSDDKTVIGDANPDFFGGINNTFTFRGFDLSVYLNFSYGNDIYNANRMMFTQMNTSNKNVLSDSYNSRFRLMDANGNSMLDDPAALKAANAGVKDPSILGSQDMRLSDAFIEDGSFLRINNITLGYTVPQAWLKKIKIQSLRVYAAVNNVYTITGYSGYDPEVSVNLSSGSLTPGIDWGAYPRARSYVFGLNISF